MACMAPAKRDGYEWVLIDTPPSLSAVVDDAIKNATLVIIPARPGVFDVNAVQETIQTCRSARKPYAVVINGAPAERDGAESRIVAIAREALAKFRAPQLPGLPRFCGGAVGYAAYDTVRYVERLPSPPLDDRGLPDLSFAFYDRMVIFDHINKTIAAVAHAHVDPNNLATCYHAACARVDHALRGRIKTEALDGIPVRAHRERRRERGQVVDAGDCPGGRNQRRRRLGKGGGRIKADTAAVKVNAVEEYRRGRGIRACPIP